MQNVDKLNPPIQYDLIWLFIGLGLMLLILIWYGLAFWLTRRKKPKMLGNLRQLRPPVDLDKLKAKYLQLIEQLYARYVNREIELRELHQNLSKLVRAFTYEANGFPALVLTLSDMKFSPYPKLTQLIGYYYPNEFSAITKGDAATSKQAAIGFVTQWPF